MQQPRQVASSQPQARPADIISIESVPVAISGAAGAGKRSGREEKAEPDMPAPDSGIAGRAANPPPAAQKSKAEAADANFTPI